MPVDGLGAKFDAFLSVLLQNCSLFSLDNLKKLLEKFNKLDLAKLKNEQRLAYEIKYICLHLNCLITKHSLGLFDKMHEKKPAESIQEKDDSSILTTLNNVQIIIDMCKFSAANPDNSDQVSLEFEQHMKSLEESTVLIKEISGKDTDKLNKLRKKMSEQLDELVALKNQGNPLFKAFRSKVSPIITSLSNHCDSIELNIKSILKENVMRENLKRLEKPMQAATLNMNEFVRVIMVDQLYDSENNNLALTSPKSVDFCILMHKLSKSIGVRVREYLVAENRDLVKRLESIFKSENGKYNSFVAFDHFLFTRCENLIKTLGQFELSLDSTRILRQLMPAVCDLLKKLAESADSRDYSAECRKSFIMPLLNQYLDEKEMSSLPAHIVNSMRMLREFLKENSENTSIDDSIYKSLLLTLYSQRTQPFQPIVKDKLCKHLESYLTANMTTSRSFFLLKKADSSKMSVSLFEFCVKFLYTMTAFNSAIAKLNDNTVVSTKMMLVILENVLTNKSWLDSVQSRPHFASFLAWFFASFRVFERENSLDRVPVSEQNFEELNHFAVKMRIQNEFAASYSEILKEFVKQATFKYVRQLIQTLSKEKPNENTSTKLMEIFCLFPEFFADNDNICDQLLGIFAALKKTNMTDMIKLVISDALRRFQDNNLSQIELKLKKFSTFTQEQTQKLTTKLQEYAVSEKLLEKNSFRAVNNMRLLSAINEKLDIDQSISIEYDRLVKVFECLVCFEDISIAVNVLTKVEQKNWLTNLIIEHISEKYCLIYLKKFSIECQDNDDLKLVRVKLGNINERVLFVFNNLLVNEYVDVMLNRGGASAEKSPKENSINNSLKVEKFNILIELMQSIVFSKELLEQLSSAPNLNVWDSILNEFAFNQYFNRKINELNLSTSDDTIEKILLYLNRIRYLNKPILSLSSRHIL